MSTHLPFRPQCLRCLPKPLTFTRTLTTPSAPSKPRPSFPHERLSYHWDTLPPSPAQLTHAASFFQTTPPTFLWSAPKFKTMSFGDYDPPEVCFLGRSNVGKSSILNALLGRPLAHTSSKPGRTKLMNAFCVGGKDGGKKLVVLDMPGYGKGGRAEWGEQVLKYLGKRRQLKRAFLLVDAKHGVKETDMQLLELFREQKVPYQIVLSKVDRMIFEGRTPGPEMLEQRLAALMERMEEVKELVKPDEMDEGGGVGEVVGCSAEKNIGGRKLGVEELRFAMLRAVGLELREKVKLGKAVEVVSFDDLPSFDMNDTMR